MGKLIKQFDDLKGRLHPAYDSFQNARTNYRKRDFDVRKGTVGET
jgi:hypothetical protein